jgi:hypothetical protein
MSDYNMRMVDEIFDQFKDKQKYVEALRRAAEDIWAIQMDETNDKMTEFAEKYEHYSSEEEKKHVLEDCLWATKEEYITTLIESWLNPDPTKEW